MAALFNSDDPHQLQYTHDVLLIDVLGGIRTEALDRMRVTLKLELKGSPRPPVRHNLDLYNDTQLEKLIRKTAERLEIGTTVIAAGISGLTAELEKYRLAQVRQQQPVELSAKLLSQGERQTAEDNLQAGNLMQQTLEDLQATGIRGEAFNSLILYLAMVSRKCSDPLSVICLAKSGTGKSYLMEKVAACIPEEDKKEHTQFSNNSFYYYKREEIRGKVFLIEDLDGAQGVLFPIRELQTKKRISKTVTVKDKTGQLRTVTLVVEGPVSIIGCTAREKIYEDNSNRAILIYLDSSAEQDQRIMDYQKQLRAGLVDTDAAYQRVQKLHNMQRLLEPVKVINPYAPLIDLPKEVFRPRRALPLLLNFIEAITFYHQCQRPRITGQANETYIETHPDDIIWAFRLLENVLFRKSDELSAAIRDFFQWLCHWNQENQLVQFYASDIRKDNRIHPRTLARYLQELTDYGLLRIKGGNKHRTGYSYQIRTDAGYDSMKDSIHTQIRQVIADVQHTWMERQKPVKPAAPKRQPRSLPERQESDSIVSV